MSAALIGIAVVVGLAAAFVAGVLLGRKFESAYTEVVNYSKELYIRAHSEVSAKLAAVVAEVEKIEAEGKAEEQAVVARLKKLF